MTIGRVQGHPFDINESVARDSEARDLVVTGGGQSVEHTVRARSKGEDSRADAVGDEQSILIAGLRGIQVREALRVKTEKGPGVERRKAVIGSVVETVGPGGELEDPVGRVVGEEQVAVPGIQGDPGRFRGEGHGR